MMPAAASDPAPPGVCPDRRAFPGANREDRISRFLSPKTLTREALKIFSAKGWEVRPAAIRRLITLYVEQGHTTLRELEPFILGYADPTGETAVRNVVRGPRR